MTPGARIAAAIGILDDITKGIATERALTRWARQSRYAGAADRSAIRDHVFTALRHWRSDAAWGGGTTGRARMIGRLRTGGEDLEDVFTGEGHAPARLGTAERAAGRAPSEGAEACDVPDWIWSMLRATSDLDPYCIGRLWQQRAPVTLRVHAGRSDRTKSIRALEREGITAQPNARAPHALTLLSGARRLRGTQLYRDGSVELQDAASQAVVASLPPGRHVLDYCAGGGGKALALAASGRHVTAHDADPRRMRDLPARAARAQTPIAIVSPEDLRDRQIYDLVLCDVPCSGSGAWRRNPEAKWRLSQHRLEELQMLQGDILERAAVHVAFGGWLVYVTCSIFPCENQNRVDAFLKRNPNWRCLATHSWQMDVLGDGFFAAHLRRRNA